jgi:hypothetical protein
MRFCPKRPIGSSDSSGFEEGDISGPKEYIAETALEGRISDEK